IYGNDCDKPATEELRLRKLFREVKLQPSNSSRKDLKFDAQPFCRNPKHQTPEKRQTPVLKNLVVVQPALTAPADGIWRFGLGAIFVFGVWGLAFSSAHGRRA